MAIGDVETVEVLIVNDKDIDRTSSAVFEEATELEKLTLQRQEFAAQAAHELRTPLTALLGYLELLCESTASGCHERVLAEGALKAARRLRRLTEDLEVTAAADLKLTLALVGIRSVVEDCVDDLGVSRSRVDNEITSEVVAYADEIRLRQVLSNVIRNALSASPDPTPVRIRATEHTDRVMIEIVDEGPGIEPELLSSVFEPFVRKPGLAPGLGVGLSVAYDLVTWMGGEISATNNKTRGATIQISLPVGRP